MNRRGTRTDDACAQSHAICAHCLQRGDDSKHSDLWYRVRLDHSQVRETPLLLRTVAA